MSLRRRRFRLAFGDGDDAVFDGFAGDGVDGGADEEDWDGLARGRSG